MQRDVSAPWWLGLSGEPSATSVEPIPARSIQFDSRKVQKGDVFVAIKGMVADGHDYLDEAVRNGAIALILDQGRSRVDIPIPQYEVRNSRASLAKISTAFENYPGDSLCLVGVTGTNGKSTTSFILNSILGKASLTTGMMTTIETRIGDKVLDNGTRLTSQEAPYIQSKLATMKSSGCSHVIIEATSIGLDMHRLDGCKFDVAIFTNLTSDHLDYHGDLASYVQAKTLLFRKLKENGHAVINGSDEYARVFTEIAAGQGATTSEYNINNVTNIKMSTSGTAFEYTFAGANNSEKIQSRLVGNYNLENMLAAIQTAESLGIKPDFIRSGIEELEQIPGRMEVVCREPFTVIVDYAHTEDSVEEVLGTLDQISHAARKIVIVGCAGERDRDRRTGIGRALAHGANYALLTDEDPRGEDSMQILDEIATAMTQVGKTEGEFFEKIPDRRAAIKRAFELAEEGDIVLIAGKGHESSIEYKSGVIPWSDVDTAIEVLNELGLEADPISNSER
mgnify:FL=1